MTDFLKNFRRKAHDEMHDPRNGKAAMMSEEKSLNPQQQLESEKRHETAKNYFYFNQMVK